MTGAGFPHVREWLAAAYHPARRDGLIAAAVLVVPWGLAWVVAPRHHFSGTLVAILAAVTIPLAGVWLAWARFRNASRSGPPDSATGSGATITGAGAVVADRGGTAIGPGTVVADRGSIVIGQIVNQPRPQAMGKPVRLADPPSLLAGREDLLTELGARLTGGDRSSPRTVVLCGLGGVGKTSVALTYAHRHLAELGVAWQFAAEDPAVLAAGFGELAAQLGARDAAETRDPVVSVHAVLAAFAGEWLLVFENAPDRASVAPFVPPAGHGRVLLTSQNQHWPHGQALQVPVLATGTAADFLVARTGC